MTMIAPLTVPLTIAEINATGYTSTNQYYLISFARMLIEAGHVDADVVAKLQSKYADSTAWSTFTAWCASTGIVSAHIYSPSGVYTVESLDESVPAVGPRVKVSKSVGLPADEVLMSDAIYYHKDAEGFLTVTVTDNNGVPFSTPTTEAFDRGGVEVFDTWQDMIDQSPDDSVVALVLDATGDTDNVIESGSASYIWNADIDGDGTDERQWHLTAEHNTINVATAWSSITSNPFGEDADGNPTYNGDEVAMAADVIDLVNSFGAWTVANW